MKPRGALSLLLWLLLLWPLGLVSPARGEDLQGIEVHRTTAEDLPANGGKVITVGFRVTAGGSQPAELIESLELPDGWSLITTPGRLMMAPGQTRVRMIAFKVGADSAPGVYELRYRATDSVNPAAFATDTLRIVVSTLTNVSIAAIDPPPYVMAGESAVLRVRVSNRGNTAQHLRVSAIPEAGLTATLSGTEVELAPGATGELSLTVKTDKDEVRATERVVRLLVQSAEARSEAVVVLSVTPRPDRTERWRRLPMTASLIGTGSREDYALQPELRGAGPVDARGKWNTDFLLRGPDAEGTGAFAERDELRFALRGPSTVALLGDQTYVLSPLTTPGTYGRGAGLALSPGRLRLGVFTVQDRFSTQPERGIAATAGAAFGRAGQYNLNFMQRRGESAADLWTVSGTAEPIEGGHVDAELAGDSAPASGLPLAGRLHATFAAPGGGFTGSARETLAAPDFGGHEQDVHRSELAGLVQLSRTKTVHGDWQREERNLAGDPLLSNAPIHQQAEARLVWTPLDAWSVDAGITAATERHRLSDAGWDEAAGRLLVARGASDLYANLGATVGGHVDTVSGLLSPGAQLVAAILALPRPMLTLRAWGSWGTEEAEVPTSLFAVDRTVGTGLRWQAHPTVETEAEARYSFTERQTLLDVQARYTSTEGVLWTARGSAGLGETPEVSGLIMVSVPFRAPIGRNLEAGRIQGRVYDADAPDQPGIAGVTLRTGGVVAVSDRDGSFTFGQLPPGQHRIEVDRASLGLHRVGVGAIPVPVEVLAGASQTVTIGATAAAKLSGCVLQVGAPALSSAQAIGLAGDGSGGGDRRLPGIGVVLESGTERVLRNADDQGCFAVGGLRPGEWTASVAPADIPAFFTLPTPGRAALTPGGSGVADVILQPRVRPILITEGGTLTIRPSEPPPAKAE